jgi:deoxyhypusine synthase
MLSDPACVIFIGLSGAMIPGGMRRVIREMIEMKLIDVIQESSSIKVFHCNQGAGYVIRVHRRADIEKLARYLYSNTRLYLKRKKIKFKY